VPGQLVVDCLLASDKGVADVTMEGVEVGLQQRSICLEFDTTVSAEGAVIGLADLLREAAVYFHGHRENSLLLIIVFGADDEVSW
jgi:hypothetical protein